MGEQFRYFEQPHRSYHCERFCEAIPVAARTVRECFIIRVIGIRSIFLKVFYAFEQI
jgi:hypothetical protein